MADIDIRIDPVDDLSLVTLALSYGVDGDTLSQMVEIAFDITLPTLGSSSIGRHDERFLGLHQDRLFILMPNATMSEESPGAEVSPAEACFLERLRDPEWLDPDEDDSGVEPPIFMSDQSDSWAMWRIQGQDCRMALERICAIDLHTDVFEIDDAARTAMEHLSAIIVRESEHGFLLLSPRSSAESFAHELTLSLANIGVTHEVTPTRGNGPTTSGLST